MRSNNTVTSRFRIRPFINIFFGISPEQFPRFLAWDEKDLRSTRQLKNGSFIEINLSSKDIYSFCQKAIETANLSSDDWLVETIVI